MRRADFRSAIKRIITDYEGSRCWLEQTKYLKTFYEAIEIRTPTHLLFANWSLKEITDDEKNPTYLTVTDLKKDLVISITNYTDKDNLYNDMKQFLEAKH